jgi:hypothetical protein
MKTLILTVSRSSAFCSGYVSGLVQAMQSEHFGGWAHMDHESDIARGRSKLMCQSLELPYDNFLWIDDDIVWDRAAFDRICSAPVDVIGGVYSKRHPTRPHAYHHILGDELEGDRDIVTVKEVGTGFLRVTRRALDEIADLCPNAPVSGFRHYFPAGVKTDGEYQSEDFAFCRMCWTAGVSVHLHRGVRLGHTGQHVYLP